MQGILEEDLFYSICIRLYSKFSNEANFPNISPMQLSDLLKGKIEIEWLDDYSNYARQFIFYINGEELVRASIDYHIAIEANTFKLIRELADVFINAIDYNWGLKLTNQIKLIDICH